MPYFKRKKGSCKTFRSANFYVFLSSITAFKKKGKQKIKELFPLCLFGFFFSFSIKYFDIKRHLFSTVHWKLTEDVITKVRKQNPKFSKKVNSNISLLSICCKSQLVASLNVEFDHMALIWCYDLSKVLQLS